MIVRTLDEIVEGPMDIRGENWASRRFLVKKDGLGFSLSETIIYPGTETPIWYKNHFEACYCIEGEGEIEALEPQSCVYNLKPGSLYALEKHDRHILRARTTMRLVCVFFPALTGEEIHDSDGSYPLSE